MSRSGGGGGSDGVVATVMATSGACSCWDVTGIGVSSEAKNCLPLSVICQPRSSRSTNESPKMSSLGARAAKRFVRLVQSVPLETIMLTQRVKSASDAPAKTFKIVIWKKSALYCHEP
jgi:hypothetical protein